MIAENRAEFDRCRISEYHAAGRLGQGITIAVLDDNEKPLQFMDYVEYPFGWFEKTKQHHSTKVARVLHEVAPEARIISLPYINEATTQMKNDSIQWILDNKPDIVNCSFHEWKNGLITKLEQLDIPVICASGNDGYNDKIRFPAQYPWTIAVGALEEYRDVTAPYSNAGEELDCLGYTNIKIPCTKGIMDFGGTSCATPMVAGMLALAGKMTGQAAKELIKQNCVDYYEKGHDWRSGHGLFVLPKLEVPTMRDINLLHPDLQPKALKLVELAKQKGIEIIISQTWRTKQEQDDLYAQGRTKPGNIVTRVQYPYSLHCWGVAFDIAVIVGRKAVWDAKYYDAVGPLGESLGLEWGGRWKSFVDRPHFQLPGHEVSELIRTYGTPENFMKGKVTKPEVKKMAGFEGPAKVVFKGKELSAGILEGKTFVELRVLAEMLGLKVYWDAATKTVTLS